MMRHRKQSIFSRNTLLSVLAVVALILLILPQSWTGGLISLVQVLVPFQDVATGSINVVSETPTAGAAAVSAKTFATLQVEKQALEHRVAVLGLLVTELRGEVSLLQATRLWDGTDSALGARGQLIPAKVVGDDLLPWRRSHWINAGSLQGVRRGAAVTSDHLEIRHGDAGELRSGLAVLLGEVLVGVVEQNGTHTSRVRLLTDLDTERKVRIGRLTAKTFLAVDGYYWLTGRGGALMEIQDVDRRLVRDGAIQVGDIVLSDPADPALPAAMVIGKVKSIRDDRNNPLLNILTVESSVNHDSLRRVFVYSPDTPTIERYSTSE